MAPSPGSLSLTFDDGPDEHWTRHVLQALRRCHARATFFMLGERVDASPAIVRAVVAAGHDVQLHGYHHVRHSELAEREIELDTELALDAFARVGVRPTHWRTPWGVRTPATDAIAARHGLSLVHWTIDTHDWRGDRASSMLARARAGLVAGAVVLMHDALGPGARRGGCQTTLDLLEPLAAAARARGLSVQPLSHATVAAPSGNRASAINERDRAARALAVAPGAR